MLSYARAFFFFSLFIISLSAEARKGGLIYPIDGEFDYISGLGAQRKGHKHQGVDLEARSETPVVAILDGVVTDVGSGGTAGYSIRIEHPNGYESFYAHLKSKVKLKVGAEVNQGDVIGRVGETGNATFPHLHFEMRQDGRLLNPAKLYGF